MYPNPANSHVLLSGDALEGASVEVFNTSGMRMYRAENSSVKETSIDLSGWSAGIYFVAITSNNGTRVEKLVKPQ